MAERLLGGFEARVRNDPDTTALIFYPTVRDHVRLSWRELTTAAGSAAQWLRSKVEPGGLVFIIDHNPLRQVQWWLAGLLADTVPGILTPPTAKLDHVRYRSELDAFLAMHPDALVLYGERTFHTPPEADRFVDIAEVEPADAPMHATMRSIDCNAPLLFQQSSGTTGLRKGILLDEKAVVNQLRSYSGALKLRPDDCILSWLPLYHDMGLIASLALAMYAGLTLVLTSPFVWLGSPAWWVSAARTHRATLSWLPNFALNVMVNRVEAGRFPDDALASLRGVVNCSEPVVPASLAAFSAHFESVGLAATAISSCYAMAENTFAVTQSTIGTGVVVETVDPNALERSGRAVPTGTGRAFAGSGRVISGTALRVMRDDHECADREVGELTIRSNCLMRAYEQPAAAGSPFDAGGWFRTGDLGYTVNGEVFVIARKKDIIIRAGRNLDPTAFEYAASLVPGVKAGRVVAVGVPNELDGTDDLVIIAERAGDDALADPKIRGGVIAQCEAQAGCVPQKVVLVPVGWLAKSSSGKISRSACREKYRLLPAGQ